MCGQVLAHIYFVRSRSAFRTELLTNDEARGYTGAHNLFCLFLVVGVALD
jgi:hypothetical protein